MTLKTLFKIRKLKKKGENKYETNLTPTLQH